jgi:hypothetical protein
VRRGRRREGGQGSWTRQPGLDLLSRAGRPHPTPSPRKSTVEPNLPSATGGSPAPGPASLPLATVTLVPRLRGPLNPSFSGGGGGCLGGGVPALAAPRPRYRPPGHRRSPRPLASRLPQASRPPGGGVSAVSRVRLCCSAPGTLRFAFASASCGPEGCLAGRRGERGSGRARTHRGNPGREEGGGPSRWGRCCRRGRRMGRSWGAGGGGRRGLKGRRAQVGFPPRLAIGEVPTFAWSSLRLPCPAPSGALDRSW